MNTTILLPKAINTDAIFNDLGRITGERLLLILSYVYCVGLWKYRMKDANMQVHWEYLEMLGGGNNLKKTRHIGEENKGIDKEDSDALNKVVAKKTPHIGEESKGRMKQYLALIGYAVEKGLIERDGSYRVGVFSKDMRFSNRDEMFKEQQTYVLTSKNSIKAYSKFNDLRRETFRGKGDVYEKIYRSVNGLYYHADKAHDYIVGIGDPVEQAKRLFYNTWMTTGYECWKVDEQGRVYTAPVIIPRDLRRFFSYDGKPMFVVDVSSCQPLLHALLYTNEEEPERAKYLAMVETNNFYNYLNEQLHQPYNLEDDIQKSKFKERVFGEIFYGHPDTKPTELTKVFSNTFPILWGEVCDRKKPNHKLLPRAMQSIEADVMINEVVGLLSGATFPVVTIHDAIMTTDDGITAVTQAIRKVFKSIYLNPSIKTQKLL